MDNFDPRSIKPGQWINWRQAMKPDKPRIEPKIDPIASEAAGTPIMANDPRLIRWAAEKAKRNRSETLPTRMIEDKVNRRELAEIFHGKFQV